VPPLFAVSAVDAPRPVVLPLRHGLASVQENVRVQDHYAFVVCFDLDSVEELHVEMQVQIERTAESLDQCRRTGLRGFSCEHIYALSGFPNARSIAG
jgi:hypothetical protein